MHGPFLRSRLGRSGGEREGVRIRLGARQTGLEVGQEVDQLLRRQGRLALAGAELPEADDVLDPAQVFADAAPPASALFDGAPFDPADARGYAASFAVGRVR